jgi:hypothetical protein
VLKNLVLQRAFVIWGTEAAILNKHKTTFFCSAVEAQLRRSLSNERQ